MIRQNQFESGRRGDLLLLSRIPSSPPARQVLKPTHQNSTKPILNYSGSPACWQRELPCTGTPLCQRDLRQSLPVISVPKGVDWSPPNAETHTHHSVFDKPHEEERKQRDLGVSGASVESVPRRTRRKFTASEKLRIVKAAETATASGERGALEALLRREAIYGSQLSAWRQQLASNGTAGLASRKPGRKPKVDDDERKVLALTKRNAELERKLAIANALIALQKKAQDLLGLALPESDEES